MFCEAETTSQSLEEKKLCVLALISLASSNQSLNGLATKSMTLLDA